jgi:hypothetical protein
VFMGEGEDVISFVPFDGFDQLPFGVLEMYFNPARITGVLVKWLCLRGRGFGRGPTLFQALAGSHLRVEPLIRARSSETEAE